MTYTNKQKADVLRRAAVLIRKGHKGWACAAINFASPTCLKVELINYIRPFWNHNNIEPFLSTSLLFHLKIDFRQCEAAKPFFRVAREKMLLAAADAMEKGLEP